MTMVTMMTALVTISFVVTMMAFVTIVLLVTLVEVVETSLLVSSFLAIVIVMLAALKKIVIKFTKKLYLHYAKIIFR